MICSCFSCVKSSVDKKQIVAVTGILLTVFVLGHLAGNLFIYLGPEAFNGYAQKLAGLRPGLYLVESVLLVVFLIHLSLTALLVLENRQARPIPYRQWQMIGEQSFAARLMPWTGTIIAAFVVWHLLDFTLTDHHGPRSVLSDGESYGLYGVVYNSFANPWHSALYILAMAALGFHLSHGIQSFAQTLGFHHPRYTPLIRRMSNGLGLLIALAYSSVPAAVVLGCLAVK
jgi:succinate dehydrogenase / fumarate reductase cytochrome b subunit